MEALKFTLCNWIQFIAFNFCPCSQTYRMHHSSTPSQLQGPCWWTHPGLFYTLETSLGMMQTLSGYKMTSLSQLLMLLAVPWSLIVMEVAPTLFSLISSCGLIFRKHSHCSRNVNSWPGFSLDGFDSTCWITISIPCKCNKMIDRGIKKERNLKGKK